MAAPLVVEDGTGVANANSYASVADADAYFDTTFWADEWGKVEAPTKAVRLIDATRMLDTRISWYSIPLTRNQGLQFPRAYLYSPDGVLIQGIPPWLKWATAEWARLVQAKDRSITNEREPIAKSISSQGSSSSVTYVTRGRASDAGAWVPDQIWKLVPRYALAPMRALRA